MLLCSTSVVALEIFISLHSLKLYLRLICFFSLHHICLVEAYLTLKSMFYVFNVLVICIRAENIYIFTLFNNCLVFQ